MLRVLEGRRDEVRERLQHRDVLVVEHPGPIRLAREHADQATAALQRDVDRGERRAFLIAEGHPAALHGVVDAAHQVGLAGEDDLARRAGAERIALTRPDLGALGLQDELEFPLVGVVARHVEGVPRDQRARGLVCELRDAERLANPGERPGQHVERREATDALLALGPDARRPHGGRGELREGEESLAVDRVEGAIGIGGGDAHASGDLSAEHHRRSHGGVDAGLAQQIRVPARIAMRLERVVADAHDLAAPDHLPHQWPDDLRRRQRGGEPEARDVDRGLATQLGDEHELGVVRLAHLLSDPPDHVRDGAGLGRQLAGHGFHAACLLDDARVAQRDRRMRREAFERTHVVLVERTHLQPTDRERRGDLALHDDRYADDRPHADVLDRWDRGRVGGVVRPRDGAARPQHGADDADASGGMDADRALAGARAGDDRELVAAAPVDRRVVRVDEEQRVARDGAEQSLRRRLLSDLGRDALKAAREPQRASAAALLATVVVDRRAQDDEHQDHDHRLAEDLRDRRGHAEPHADDLLTDATDEVCRPRRGHAMASEPVHRERADRDHHDERDAALVGRARDHPGSGGGEIADHDERRRLR